MRSALRAGSEEGLAADGGGVCGHSLVVLVLAQQVGLAVRHCELADVRQEAEVAGGLDGLGDLQQSMST